MSDTQNIHGIRVLVFDDSAKPIARERDANDLLAAAWAEDATLVTVPVSRLSDDFFKLSTGLAGAVVQKFVNYGLRLAIVGDISEWTANSRALRDFVYESNNGHHLWFVSDLDNLSTRLHNGLPSPRKRGEG